MPIRIKPWSSISQTIIIISVIMLSASSLPGIQPEMQISPIERPTAAGIQGPFAGEVAVPFEWDGDVSKLPRPEEGIPPGNAPQPLRYLPGQGPKTPIKGLTQWVDPVVQTEPGGGAMPNPIRNFAGISFARGGSGWPPDTNGDVGPNHYIQTVNTSIGIYNKSTGAEMAFFTFNDFFQGTKTPCDNDNDGDPVVVYDRFADRWIITDFSVAGPYFECIAVSQTGDPVAGGWYFYGVKIHKDYLNDYPKIGVWRDAYYFSFNMFQDPNSQWRGVQVWAFKKDVMLAGGPLVSVYFVLGPETGYDGLLPAHALTLPPDGAAEYYTSVSAPDKLLLWKFKPNWADLALSTFTGPVVLNIPPYAMAASIPQLGSSTLVDSLSPRLMMQLIYRSVNSVESLWMTHTVTNGGVAGMRWYEVRQPGTAPALYQSGTYQPDANHRWMGSLSVDRDGNMALGYSISSANMFPGIRYTGRLAGETLGLLPQAEKTLINGSGSQTQTTRWGDYSAMAVDPVDDCTFWYTTEYYLSTGYNWQTRIGAFKYLSCGQPKGVIEGVVRNAITLQPVKGAQVFATSGNQTMTVTTDGNGAYRIPLAGGIFNLTAGPLLPGYPTAATVNNVPLTAGSTTTQDILLSPVPNLVEWRVEIDDNVPQGNSNGYPEPGEAGIFLWESLRNNGAITSTNITAQLFSLTPGVTIITSTATYPNIDAGQFALSPTPFSFSVGSGVPCGTDLQFRKTVLDSQKSYTINFSLNASVPMERRNLFFDNVEGGTAGWTTGGTNNQWVITTLASQSPTHSWTDSPNGDYKNNTASYLQSPVYNLAGLRHVQIGFWSRYFLEPGYDYVYLDYSLDGGTTWSSDSNALATLNANQVAWKPFAIDAPMLDGQSNVALRFRLVTDGGVTADGIYLDDIYLSYQPFTCTYNGTRPAFYLPLLYR